MIANLARLLCGAGLTCNYARQINNYKKGAFTMLLQNFYKNALAFAQQNKQQIIDYAQQLKKRGGFNDFNLRLAFDCFYYQQQQEKIHAMQAGNNDFDFVQQMATICNLDDKNKIIDKHIATLYKKVLKDCNILQ